MEICIVIVNYSTPSLVLDCLLSVTFEREFLPNLKAVVVDNASPDESVTTLQRSLTSPAFAEWVEFLPLELNGGFGWGNNQAILHLINKDKPPEAILLLNPDTLVERGAIKALANDLSTKPEAGAIGSQLLDANGDLSSSAFRFPSITREFLRGVGVHKVGQILGIKPIHFPAGYDGPADWLTGASVLLRTDALREVGLFDTGFFLYFEEVDLMRRLGQAGWRCYCCPASRVAHIEGAATGISGKSKSSGAPPDYVLHSRYRYFTLAGGPMMARLAEYAWFIGDSLGTLIGKVFPSRRPYDNSMERAALRRLCNALHPKKVAPAVTRSTEKPGAPPAWMC